MKGTETPVTTANIPDSESKSAPATLSRSEFSAAYGRGFPITLRFLISRGINPARAEEFAQAAWAKGWERLDALRNADRVVEWVNTIALNVFRNKLRRTKETAELPLHVQGKSGVSSARIELGKALQSCNETERKLLIDRYVEGYSSKEAAERHNLTPVAVRVRTLRARRKAMERLSPAANNSLPAAA